MPSMEPISFMEPARSWKVQGLEVACRLQVQGSETENRPAWPDTYSTLLSVESPARPVIPMTFSGKSAQVLTG